MGIIQKQSIKGLAYAYVGAVLGFITTGILMPEYLATEEIGLLRILVSYASLLAQFSGLGFSIVVVKMFPYFRDQKSKHHGFMGLFLIISFIGFVLTLFFFQIYQTYYMEKEILKSPLLHQYFHWTIPLTIFILLYTIADTFYRSLFNAIKGTALKEILQRIFILIALALFITQTISFDHLVRYYAFAFALPPIILFYYLWKEGQIKLWPDFNFITKKIRKQISNIAFYGLLSSFSGILVLNIDVLMVESFLGLSDAGIYTITFFFGALILIPSRPVTRIAS
ncbi:MAG: oligosaccharide flippase family protein, partial [Bacteroidales bacterium]|nr:oligosaccharide flippase family protein [Bacteroidales bacterium]